LNQESAEFQEVMQQIDNIGQLHGKNLLTALAINTGAELYNMTQQPDFDAESPEFQQAVEYAESQLNAEEEQQE